MRRELIVDADKCTGCQVCELICSWVKQEECNPKSAHIKVLKNEEMGIFVPSVRPGCDLCGECVTWCSQQALEIVGAPEATTIRKNLHMGRFPALRIR